MKKDQGNITDDLLVKYLLGETSAGEDGQVQDWVKESRENKDHLDQLRLIWNQSKALGVTAGTPADEAWQQFRARLHKPAAKVTIPRSYSWVKIAALVMVLAGAGTIAWFAANRNTTPAITKVEAPAQNAPATTPEPIPDNTPAPETANNDAQHEAVNTTYPADNSKPVDTKVSTKAGSRNGQRDIAETFYRTNDFVCNGTPCPLEICIIQTIKCPGSKASAISTCSTLMPDQSGQVKYKAPDKIAENCKVTVQQIRIKRVTTGETIVLDENSQPSTAEEVFNYITGRKKGNILAGMFHADCNNNDHEHTLKLDNNFGNLVLQ